MIKTQTKRCRDLIVIGGGINGTAIARDASIRGLDVLLLEAQDLATGASGNNGRMIHGGLRYLETGQIGLVIDTIRERATLLKIAPHLVARSSLLLPIFQNKGRPAWMIRLGLLFMDILGFGSVPLHRRLSREMTLQAVPSLDPKGLRGAFVMHDAWAENAERLTIENAIDAAQHGAEIKTYAQVKNVEKITDGEFVVTWSENSVEKTVSAAVVVNATGASANDTLVATTGQDDLSVTKAAGSFLVIKAFAGAPERPVFFESKFDRRPIIITPWLDNYLIGTTDRVIEGPVSQATATEADVTYLLESLQNTFTGIKLDRSDILYSYTGVRALAHSTGASHKISRDHVVLNHDAPHEGLITVFGGKLSTFRSLAAEVTNRVFSILKRRAPKSRTATMPLPGAQSGEAAAENLTGEISTKTRERLRGLYGSRADKILSLAGRSTDLLEVIDVESGAIAAELVFAVEQEFAQTLSDILLRRTLLGRRQNQALKLLKPFRKLAKQHLGWSKQKIESDIQAYVEFIDKSGISPVPRDQVRSSLSANLHAGKAE